jgi:hypothetical protein
MENMFSYGTLQQENVQLESFDRVLDGTLDVLQGYQPEELEITDEFVLKTSQKKSHPIIFSSNSLQDEINGTIFKITSSELLHADYKRAEVTLKSGIRCWAYIGKR